MALFRINSMVYGCHSTRRLEHPAFLFLFCILFGEFTKNVTHTLTAAIEPWKRVCFGEGLARMELFLFLTSILQNFKLKPPGNLEKLDLAPYVTGIGNLPHIYQLSFIAK